VFDTDLRACFRKHSAINLLIPILEENCFATIAALGPLVGGTWGPDGPPCDQIGRCPLRVVILL